MRLNSCKPHVVLCLIAAVAVLSVCQPGRAEDAAAESKNPLLAELEKATFVEHSPEDVLKKLEGKTVGLYMTAKWCVACRTFTPKLIKLRDENADEFEFVMVSWDRSLKDEKAYLAKAEMNVPAIRFDDPLVKKLNERFQVNGIPTLIVYDKSGQVITLRGWEYMSWTLRPGVLENLGESEEALAWQRMVRPFQDALQATRAADLETMKPVIEKYRDFPRIDAIADWLGYYGASEAVGKVLREVGIEMAADWENQKHHLDYLSDLAVTLKPNADGYIGCLEGSATDKLFEELGKASIENAEILDYLNRMMKSGKPLRKRWAMAGWVAAAVHGNDDATKQVLDWKNLMGGSSHAPLRIYPVLYPACHEGNARALDLAKQLYVNDPYYVYKAMSAFVVPALDGNLAALEALGLIAAGSNAKYAEHAVRFLNEAADKGHGKAKEILQAATALEPGQQGEGPSTGTPGQGDVAAKPSEKESDAHRAFGGQLAKDCYVLVDGKLAPVSGTTFSNTKLYVVYYSHIDCTVCVPTTEAMNRWYAANMAQSDVSLVFATRGEETNEKLLRYLEKGLILYPAIDTKYYMSRELADPHPFYEDADDGVPFIRFFDGSGQPIDPKKHGVQDIYDCDSITENLAGIVQSMLKSLN